MDLPAPLVAPGATSLPPMWDAELVGERLVQAFVTLDRLPRLRGPREPGDHWPRTLVEWADRLAQAELEESERREREKLANRTVIRPSAIEIQRMDLALEWLRELHGDGYGNGSRDNPLGAALGARPLGQKTLRRKEMGTAHVFSQTGESTGKSGRNA